MKHKKVIHIGKKRKEKHIACKGHGLDFDGTRMEVHIVCGDGDGDGDGR